MQGQQLKGASGLITVPIETLNAADDLARNLRRTIDKQSEDEALWAVYPRGIQPISEAYLQHELRRLHLIAEEYLIVYESLRGLK